MRRGLICRTHRKPRQVNEQDHFSRRRRSLMRSLILLLVLGLAATTTPVRSSSRTIPKRANAAPTTVLVLGDSLAAGHGLRRSEAFPALLTEKANASGLDLNVINAGATGGTTAGGLSRISPLLHRQVEVVALK